MVKEYFASVPLPNLLDHTALRIIQEQKESITEVVENLPESQELSRKLICKWGLMGFWTKRV